VQFGVVATQDIFPRNISLTLGVILLAQLQNISVPKADWFAHTNLFLNFIVKRMPVHQMPVK